MNAHQFFDVFPLVVAKVGDARSPTTSLPPQFAESILRDKVNNRHGATVASEAVEHFRRLFESAKTGVLK